MTKKAINLNDYINKEFYIIDCEDFTYFARKVHAIGFEMSPDEIIFIINLKNRIINEYRKMYKEELEQFKSFKEASQKAKELNELPKNKTRAEQWFKNRQTMLEMHIYWGRRK